MIRWEPKEKEIDGYLETNNERELFVVGQIIIERILDRVLLTKFDIPQKILNDTRFPMQLKMELIKESNIIEKKTRENIGKINSLRNAYSHMLNPDGKSVKNWLLQLHYLKSTPKSKLELFDKYRICVKQTFNELQKLNKK